MLKTVYHKHKLFTISVLSGIRCHERYRPGNRAPDSSKLVPHGLTDILAWITQYFSASTSRVVVASILFCLGLPGPTAYSHLIIGAMMMLDVLYAFSVDVYLKLG